MIRLDGLARRIHKKCPDYYPYEIKEVARMIIKEIECALTENESVQLNRLGVFYPKTVPMKYNIHPGTREWTLCPAHITLGIRPSSILKEALVAHEGLQATLVRPSSDDKNKDNKDNNKDTTNEPSDD